MKHAISTMSLARPARRVALLSTFLASCSGGGTGAGPNAPTGPGASTPVLTTVSVSLTAATLQVGWSDTARAAGFDQNGAPIGIGAPVWSTASDAIAIVDGRGVVTGVSIGQTTVIATVGGKQGRIALPVVPVEVRSVVVDPPADSAAAGESFQFTAATLDAVGDTLTGRSVAWSSTRTTVATVSVTGLVTAVTAGTSIIVAASEGQSGAAVLTVTGSIPGGLGVAIATPVRDAVIGDTLKVHAVAYTAYPIATFVASVGTKQLALSPVGKGAWGGQMLLAGTFYGTFQLVVTVTDQQGAMGIDSVEFIRKKLVLGGSSPPAGRKQVVPVIPVLVP